MIPKNVLHQLHMVTFHFTTSDRIFYTGNFKHFHIFILGLQTTLGKDLSFTTIAIACIFASQSDTSVNCFSNNALI